jgi:ABC-type proline/glycine betaine transport system permease subunit
MSPLILVYIALIAAVVIGVLVGYIRYRSRQRTLTEGQAHVAPRLDKPRDASRP